MDEKMKNKMNQRGQITIFIIIALIVVVIIAMIFVVSRSPRVEAVDEENPQAFIESCTTEAVNEALDILMPQGGYISPQNYKLYQNEKVAYLCYTNEYYRACSNQVPMLIEHIEKEIADYIEPIVAGCFQTLESSLETRYDIETGAMELEPVLQPNQVIININKEFKMQRGDNIRNFDYFKVISISPIYELAKISLKILSRESLSCSFDYIDYIMLYPENDIRKFVTGDSARIYTLNKKNSDKKFKFALRNCVIPPGF